MTTARTDLEGAPRLFGREIVVIGGSSGIGFALAKLTHSDGAKVTIVGRSEEKLARATTELPGARFVVADISRELGARRIFEGFSSVDHVYISAGTHHHGHIAETALSDLHAVIDERLWGIVHVVRFAKPLMPTGSITFTSGTLSSRPRAGAAMQSVALAAVEALVPALALELSPVRVNAVCPGSVDTPLLGVIYGEGKAKHLANRAAALPSRKAGAPNDVARAVMLLMTNDYINGEVLHIDGGGRFVSR